MVYVVLIYKTKRKKIKITLSENENSLSEHFIFQHHSTTAQLTFSLCTFHEKKNSGNLFSEKEVFCKYIIVVLIY